MTSLYVGSLLWRQNFAKLAHPHKHAVRELEIVHQVGANYTGGKAEREKFWITTGQLAGIKKIGQFAVAVAEPATHYRGFHRGFETVEGKIPATPSGACCVEYPHIGVRQIGCLLEQRQSFWVRRACPRWFVARCTS